MGLSGMLITAQEKERSRLASEIHDAFSQRLALLALGLENAEEAISTSPGEAVRQMHSPLNSASEIGADLHTFRIVSIPRPRSFGACSEGQCFVQGIRHRTGS
jgi:signal transduction histidine kinase